jgi:hypothetical protein
MSNRTVWPYVFVLRVAAPTGAPKLKEFAAVRRKYFPKSAANAVPTALRWVTDSLGFPREPFHVYRRVSPVPDDANLSANGMAQISPGPTTVAGTLTIPVAQNDLQYFVMIGSANPAANASLTVDALDASQRPIPGQSITVTTNKRVTFRSPGIASLRVTGTGHLGPIHGIGETKYANLPDWQLIEVVGLPFQANEQGTAYNTLPQGFVTPALDGVNAAIQRVTIATMLQADPPPSGIATFPVPPWPTPNPSAYVQALRSTTPNTAAMASMAGRCMTWAVDSNPNRMQVQYNEALTMTGITQVGVPNPTPSSPTTVQVPVVGAAMLGVATDSYAAVALGYGTVDMADASPTPARSATISYDYMVTAPFRFPPPLNTTLTLAALSSLHPPVETPAGLAASVKLTTFPLARNKAAPASIKLSWQPAGEPQAYAVLASRTTGSTGVLNSPRASAIGGYTPYVATELVNPDPNVPPDQQLPSFIDTAAAPPLHPPAAVTNYLVAGLDVFGQWSSWKPASASLSPAPLVKPHIRNVAFIMDAAGAVGHVVPATLRIDFAWDWQDRAPSQIRLTGNFVSTHAMLASPLPPGAPSGALATPPFVTGFATAATGPAGPPIVLTFAYANQAAADNVAHNAIVPVIDAAHAGVATVSILSPPAQPVGGDGNMTQYRLEIRSMSLDFAVVNEIAFAVYATGTEEIRPTEWSDANNAGTEGTGRIARALDPTPPSVIFNPPAIQWTALPDAAGVARGVLQWTADPKAVGYYVWEATESALWELLSPNTPPPPPPTPMVTRAANLRALIAANQDASLEAFARLNNEPIAGDRTEVELPTSASTLYVYRISAITATNVQATRSAQVAYFAVPQRNTPGAPRLMVRDATPATPQIQVIVLPVESSAAPAGYRVFRVRNTALANDGHTMGPAKFGETASGWSTYVDTPRNATSQRALSQGSTTGQTIVDATAAPSWYPYFYRATAIGASSAGTGDLRHSGESGFSQAQSAYALPPNAPQVVLQASQNFPFGKQLTFAMDLPLTPSPVGPALVEVLCNGPDPNNPNRTISNPVVSLAPLTITAGTFGTAPPVLSDPLLLRTPAAGETWTLFARIPATPAGPYALRFTDPLGRQSIYQI